MNPRCLICYGSLEGEAEAHAQCSLKMFQDPTPPIFPFEENKLQDLALKTIQSHKTITGVQSKLSLNIATEPNTAIKKFTIVGLWGGYILKPSTPHYNQLPEIEDVTMHLAELVKISVVPHCLMRLASGKLAYITRRVDRKKDQKIHMEDMCQLTGRITEDKYLGSYEQIMKIILKFSANPILDGINFFEIVIFSFLTGNADMHLKNFSLIDSAENGLSLSPAYDLVATAIVHPNDKEEMALTLNGKKKKLIMNDFVALAQLARIESKQIENIISKLRNAKILWHQMIDISFMNEENKIKFKNLIDSRFQRLEK